MAKKYALIFLGGSGSRLKQIQFSALHLAVFGVAVAALVGAAAFVAVDYVSLRNAHQANGVLERNLSAQTEEVNHQRQQIQLFAKEINALKKKIVRMDSFEERIRVMANIDQHDGHDGLFGVGGSVPEDLNPQIDLRERHQRLIKDMHQQVEVLDRAATTQTNDFESLLGRLEAQKNLLAHTPAIRPTEGWITSRFGYRVSPFTGKREFHKGWDIANRKGTEIVATADGIATFTGTNGNLGTVLVIDHGYGITTRYAHLDAISCKRGAQVSRGQVVAKMGNSGRTTGPHLHYEVRLNGVPVNPSKYILN